MSTHLHKISADLLNQSKKATESVSSLVATAQHKSKTESKPRKTLLKDLPFPIRSLFPILWDQNNGINDPIKADGTTPLIWALQNNIIEVVEGLLKCQDLDVNCRRNQETVLCIAIEKLMSGFLPEPMFRILLMRGADPSITYRKGDGDDNKKILNELIKGIDKDNWSPVTARRQGHFCLPILLEYIWYAVIPTPIIDGPLEMQNPAMISTLIKLVSADCLVLIYSYIGVSRLVNDFSIVELDEETQRWIQLAGERCFEQRIEETEQQQRDYEYKKYLEESAQAQAAYEASKAKLKGDVESLNTTVARQAARIELLEKQMAQVIGLLSLSENRVDLPNDSSQSFYSNGCSGVTGFSLGNPNTLLNVATAPNVSNYYPVNARSSNLKTIKK